MNWYRVRAVTFGGGNQSAEVVNTSPMWGLPYYRTSDGLTYNTKERPIIKYRYLYYVSGYGTSGVEMYYSQYGYFKVTGKPSPTSVYFASDSPPASGYWENVESSYISGKFRCKALITGLYNSYLNLPVNAVITKNDGTQLTIQGIWAANDSYPTGNSGTWPNYTPRGTSFRLMEKDTQDPTSYINVNFNNMSSWENSVWDFGTTPQLLPSEFVNFMYDNFDPIYPYTFTVKSNDGQTILAEKTECPAIKAATVTYLDRTRTLTLTGVNDREYVLTWENTTPAGKQFLGLAYGANEVRASIPTGRTTPVTWDGSLTIYEAYGTYRPPVTTFDINLYQSSAEVNRVDKTDYLTGVGTLSGVLREECSIIAPSITFKQTTVPTFNYVYIAAFGRYYYVTGITSVSKDIWRMSLSCDVLMTWKDDIRALTAIIARQENSFNPLLLDSELPAQANQNVTVTEFPAGGFNTGSAIEHPFLLTVVGA